MKKAGPPWLSRSDVAGNDRQASLTLASCLLTSACANRLTGPVSTR